MGVVSFSEVLILHVFGFRSNVKIWGAYPGYNNLNLNKTVKFFPLNVDDAVTVA